jgi:L-lactate dehydrogenase complex protein LldG
VLGAIRARLGVKDSADAGRRGEVEGRLSSQGRHLIPQRADRPPEQLRSLFAAQLRAASATVIDVTDASGVPAAVAGYLRRANLPLDFRLGQDPWLAAIDWGQEPGLRSLHGRAQESDGVGLSRAIAGIAETGTLVLASGPENPVTITYLPETHIVAVRAQNVVGPFEDAFELVRAGVGRGMMPRTLNLVSGPSRTADVGGRLVTGAHGPRRLCVLLVHSP